MTVSYRNYQGHRINELVFADTCNAGINKGSGNEKAQDLDIGGQATAGARNGHRRCGMSVRLGYFIERRIWN